MDRQRKHEKYARYARYARYASMETQRANEGRAEEIREAFERKKEFDNMHKMTLQLIEEGRNEDEIKCTLIGLFPELASELMNSAIEKNVDGTIKISRLDAQINDIWNKFSPQSKANKIQRNNDDDGR